MKRDVGADDGGEQLPHLKRLQERTRVEDFVLDTVPVCIGRRCGSFLQTKTFARLHTLCKAMVKLYFAVAVCVQEQVIFSGAVAFSRIKNKHKIDSFSSVCALWTQFQKKTNSSHTCTCDSYDVRVPVTSDHNAGSSYDSPQREKYSRWFPSFVGLLWSQ